MQAGVLAEVDRDRGRPLARADVQRDPAAPRGVLGEAAGERSQDRVAVDDGGAREQAELAAAGLRRAGAGMMGVLASVAIRLSPSLALGRTL